MRVEREAVEPVGRALEGVAAHGAVAGRGVEEVVPASGTLEAVVEREELRRCKDKRELEGGECEEGSGRTGPLPGP